MAHRMAKNNGHFKPGCKAGPGRPKGSVSGRTKALGILDTILGKEKNLKKLHRALQHSFTKNPVRFFKTFVMPLLTKEQIVKLESVDKVPVRIILSAADDDDGGRSKKGK